MPENYLRARVLTTRKLTAPPQLLDFHEAFIGVSRIRSSIEALERFVRQEPLRRDHECVFGVLALEGEPVDSRL